MNSLTCFKLCWYCKHYDFWMDYDNYGGLVNECKKADLFCFPTDTAVHCKYYELKSERRSEIEQSNNSSL